MKVTPDNRLPGRDSGSPAIHLADASISQLQEVHRLAMASGLAGWSPADYAAALKKAEFDLCCAVCESSGRVRGISFAQLTVPEMELLQLAVAAACQRRGLGTALLQRSLAEGARAGCRRCYLEVRAASAGAIEFYLSHGFEKIATRRSYYRNPPDSALVMARGLDPEADGPR